MKITAQKDFKRFDFTMKPRRQMQLLRPVTWLLSFPAVWKHRTKITKVNMEGLKPPFILLCNHNAFFDFMVATVALFPWRANYIVAIDGFIGREGLMRNVGCICKRKFTNDISVIRHVRTVLKNGDIAVIYPEARYSLCGTNAVLPESLGKMSKMLGAPVVTLITRGNHINSPFWNLKERGNRTEACLKQLITKEEIGKLSVNEINRRITAEFIYDDFAWQRDNKVRVTYADRAKGLHKVLYQCPVCSCEYHMNSGGSELWCDACGKHWNMNYYGELEAVGENAGFSHIPDWYEWERAQVRREIENGSYRLKVPVHIDSLPNAKGYIPLGAGQLLHDKNGFTVAGHYAGEDYRIEKSVKSLYSCHIEYNYLGKYGDCIDLNTLTDTFYIYPEGHNFSVTKIALATEELYEAEKRKEAEQLRQQDAAAQQSLDCKTAGCSGTAELAQ